MQSFRWRLAVLLWILAGLAFVFLTEQRRIPLGQVAGEAWKENRLRMEFRWCPAGEYVMGVHADRKIATKLSEGFWIGRYEVTREQWLRLMETQPWRKTSTPHDPTEHLPAAGMTWWEAMEFCRRFSEAEHREGRLAAAWEYTLPTEAQWEYACRAGSETKFSFGDDPFAIVPYGWTIPPGGARYENLTPHVVGLKKPNDWGLSDCHGNVREWCLDAYAFEGPGRATQESERLIDPRETQHETGFRTVRGGSYLLEAEEAASAARQSMQHGNRRPDLGFRIVLTPVKLDWKWGDQRKP